MNSLIRDGNNFDSFEWQNNSGNGTATQYEFVLLDNSDGDAFPVFGYVPDEDGIIAAAEGNINTVVGSIWQVDQIDNTVQAMTKYAPIFATPGYNDLHSVALDGDWCVAYVEETQTDNDWIKLKMVQPFKAENIT